MATAFHKVTNNAASTLIAAINSSVATFGVASGDGAEFPTGKQYLTVGRDGDYAGEIVEVVSRSSDTFTATGGRGSQGTTASAHDEGVAVECLLTAAHITELQDAVNAIENGTTTLAALSVSGDSVLTGDLAINGGDLTSTSSTFNILASPTTVNFAAAATAINISTTSSDSALTYGSTGAGARSFVFNTAAAKASGIYWQSAGSNKWAFYRPASTDAVQLYSYTNAAAVATFAPTLITFAQPLTVSGNGTFTGDLTLGSNTAGLQRLILNSAAANYRLHKIQSAGVDLWYWGTDNSAQSGSDAGAPWKLTACTDGGVRIDDPITITRAAGGLMTLVRPIMFTPTTAVAAAFTLNQSYAGGAVIANYNTSANAAAFASVEVGNAASVSDSMRMVCLGTAFTTAGGFVQDSGVLSAESNLSGGMSIMTRHASGNIRLYVGSHTNLVATFDTSNNLTLAGDLAINGGDLTSTASTFNFLTSGVTTFVGLSAATSMTFANSAASSITVAWGTNNKGLTYNLGVSGSTGVTSLNVFGVVGEVTTGGTWGNYIANTSGYVVMGMNVTISSNNIVQRNTNGSGVGYSGFRYVVGGYTEFVAASGNTTAGAATTVRMTFDENGITMADGRNFIFNTTTGTKIGTGTTQKIGFWNATPVAQYATTGTTTGYTGGGGTALTHSDTFTGNQGSTAYTIGDIVRALKLCGIIAQ